MSSKIENNWKISDESFEIKSALDNIYEDLVEKFKLFPNRYSLFTAGLVYGLLYDKRHDIKSNASYIKLFAIGDQVNKDVIDLIYYVLDDGNKEKVELWNEMLYIADGGVKELDNIFKTNKNFRVPYLLDQAELLWPDRLQKLHNINVKTIHEN